jgi:transcriptional adapter 2-alpha
MHARTHAPDFPLITADWTAREELSLLDGIEQYGIGNWLEVKGVVGTKDKAECEYHYFGNYINAARNDGQGPVPDVSRAKSKVEFGPGGEAQDYSDCIEPSVAGAGPIWQKFTKSEWKKYSMDTKHIVRESIRYYDGKPPGSDFVGYMPSRGDFDIEWDNDAEHLICDCVFDDKKDTELDRDVKTKVLEIYNWKLDERVRRKQFVIERGLLDFKKQQQSEKRKSKEERELHAKMRPFARFWPQEEHEEYTKALVFERRIRDKIKQLQIQRRNGITNFEDAEQFERHQEMRRFNQRQDEKQGKRAAKAGSSAPPSNSTSSQRNERARNRLADEPEDGKPPSLGDLGLGLGPETKKHAAFDIKSLVGVDLLSKLEIQLCTSLRLPPAEYINAKDLLIREYLRLGYVRLERANLICPSLEPAKMAKVYEEIVKAGWIRPNPPSAIDKR